MAQNPNDPELSGIEAALGGLVPASSGLDRDRLMFQAGALSRSGSRLDRWVWPSVAAVLSMVVACESEILVRRPAREVVHQIVVVREPAEARPAAPARDRADAAPAPLVIRSPDLESAGEDPESFAFLSETAVSDHQRLQALVLRFGLDAFPEPVARPSPSGGPSDPSESNSSTAGALRQLELEKLLKPGDHS
jgi:hypothetical protein